MTFDPAKCNSVPPCEDCQARASALPSLGGSAPMVPVKCGFCRAQDATALVQLNDVPAFACEDCIAKLVAYAERMRATLPSEGARP